MYFLKLKIHSAAQIDGLHAVCSAPFLASGFPAVPVGESLTWPQCQQHGSMRAQLCLTLYSPMDCSLPGSSVHGILRARILEWVAIPYTRGSSRLRDRAHISCVSCIGRWVLYHLHWMECNPCVCVCVCVCARMLSCMWAGFGEKCTQYIKTSKWFSLINKNISSKIRWSAKNKRENKNISLIRTCFSFSSDNIAVRFGKNWLTL